MVFGVSLHMIIMFLLVALTVSSIMFTLYYLRQRQIQARINRKLANANIKIQQYLNAVDASNLVCITTPDGNFKYMNSQYLGILGYTFSDIIGRKYSIIAHEDTPAEVYANLFRTVADGNIWSGTIQNRTKDGKTVYLETSVVPIQDDEGNIVEFMSIRKDVTELLRQKAQIQKQYTDPLTGFPNRTRMRLDLETAENPALAVINIDSFSTINAFYGLETGDAVLINFADSLKAMVFSDMSVYRLSGDEFAILAVNENNIDKFNGFIKVILSEITDKKFINGDNEIMLNLTAGTAGGRDNLLIKAGMAMKQARLQKKNIVTYADVKTISDNLKETIQYSHILRDAIKMDRVVPHFQPIVCSQTGEIFKHEALIRIDDGNGSFLPPMCFLELSKKLKLYNDISTVMMLKSVEKIADGEQRISINFDIEDVLNPKIQNALFAAVKKFNLQGRLTIEITESEGIDNLSELSDFVATAKQQGCLIAIDDFGTGYSNFMYILSLEPDFVKIDGSITRQLLESKRARLLTETIVSMCRKAGIKTIAEFVSSEELYHAMRDMGADYLQGYYFGKPERELQ